MKNDIIQTQNYFEKSCNVWFPYFEEMIAQMEQRYQKYPVPFTAMLAMISYFRTQISRQQFLAQFFAQEAPQKLLPSDRGKYVQVKKICTAYQNNDICNTDLDEQLLLCFRSRPTDNVFSPAFEEWNDICNLMSRLTKKMKTLPVHFDGTSWNVYLCGKLKRNEYVDVLLAWKLTEQLLHPAYVTDTDAFVKKYATEISVCMNLHKLCTEYKNGLFSTDYFDTRFLELAKAFCSDIPE